MSSGTPLTDWVDAKLRLWGYAKRRLLQAQERYPESFAGRLVEEGPGASLGHQGGSRDVEVFTGDALEVALAIHRSLEARKLTDRQLEVLTVHYIVKGPVKRKAPALDLCVSRYYELLGIAHRHLAEAMS